MGKKEDSIRVPDAGVVGDVTSSLREDVIALGGSDDDLRRLLSNKALRHEVAKLLVASSGRVSTLARMIADAGFTPARCSSDITEEHFPLGREGPYDASGLRLFGGGEEWSIDGVEAAIKPGGGRLEGLVRGLAYIKANPGILKGGPVVFPASSWVDPGGFVYVPFAGLDGGEPWLGLFWVFRAGRWLRRCRFLVSGESGA